MSADVLSQHVNISMPDIRAMSQPAQIDPDVSATLSDFLAYTEHLPSAVIRSMTLIEEQDTIASEQQQKIHELLVTYSTIPELTSKGQVPNPAHLRKEISHAYHRLEKARRMATAESLRIADHVKKDQVKLDVITHKLKTMPMPPSRDPTPEPISSPQIRKAQSVSEKKASHRVGSAPRIRERKIMVPGEVLPPPNPESPELSEPSDNESLPPSPPPQKKRYKSEARQRTPKPLKEPKEKKERTPKPPRARVPGQPGTNVHSSVAGISTSNALLALHAPPADAVPGSAWLPWKRITEFELAKLRKRMKKNAIWLPSPAMRNRELKILGRGQQAMEMAKQRAAETGQQFVDEFGPEWVDPTRRMISGEEPLQAGEILEPDLMNIEQESSSLNRGMILNEAKKRKRERLLEEQAIQAQLNSEHLTEIRPGLTDGTIQSDEKPTIKIPASSKKRKRDGTPAATLKTAKEAPSSPDVLNTNPPKKLKLSIPSRKSLEPDLARSPNRPIASPLRSARTNPALDPTSATTPPTTASRRASTKITLKRSKAASAEPPNRRSLRRGSNASLPGAGRAGSVDSRPANNTTTPAAATGRRRRPAPGVITADEDGRAKVSVGKRKAAPKKKSRKEIGATTVQSPAGVGEESEVLDVDPDEPRYCLCGDVSWGTMIACDNEDCDKEWFHLSCVNLEDMPPRRTKWYCPECRKKLKKGVDTNGIVK